MNANLKNIVDELEAESAVDFVGLWEVIKLAKEAANDEGGQEVRQLAFELLRMMLSRGFRAGFISKTGTSFEPWPNQEAEAVLHRISAEWSALGRDPSIGDIVWFDRYQVH
jgi:hypothetical protein